MIGPIYQCAACDTIFAEPNVRYFLGQAIEVCPNRYCAAEVMDWDHLAEDVIRTEFYLIIGDNFNEARRTNLREIAESMMQPFNRLYREL